VKTLAALALVAVTLSSACAKPSADALFAKGNDYFERGMAPEAILQYRLAVQADPKRGDIRLKLSDAYLRQREGSAALKEAVNAADLLPKDIGAQIRVGNLWLMAGSFDEAQNAGTKALAIDAHNPDALILMGNALAGLKKLDDAIAEYQEALVLDPTAEAAAASIGAIQFSRGQAAEADATLRRAVAAAPTSVVARLALANFLWASRRLPETEAELKAALTLKPADLAANRALGTFFIANGKAAEAEPYFKTIAEAANTDEARLALADYYLEIRRLDDARAILTPLSLQPASFGPASLRLAAIEVSRKNTPAASALVHNVLEQTPKYAPARLFELRLLLMDGHIDQALAAAEALVKDEPNNAAGASASAVIGSIEASRDRLEDARKAYENALRIQPQSMSVALALAHLQLRLGDAEQAKTFARQVLTTDPKNPAARAVIVRADLLRGDLTKAAEELASLEKEFPNAVPVLNLLAARDLAARKPAAAYATYLKVVSAAPDDLEALQGLVVIDLQAGRKKEAVDRVNEALKRLPPTADLHVLAARANIAAGNAQRGEELLKEAIQREPARLAAYSLLGQLYASQKRLADARDQFQELVRRNPQSVSAQTMLGMLLEAQNDVPGAEAQYQKTVGVDPKAPVAANNLAWIYVASGRNLDEALQLAQSAQRSLPDEPHVNDTLGWIYYRKGMFPQAVRHLELSVARDATDPATHFHLGMAYVAAGEIQKGKKSLETALGMSPAFAGADEARKALSELKR